MGAQARLFFRALHTYFRHGGDEGNEGSQGEEDEHYRRDGGSDEGDEGNEGSQGKEDEHNCRDRGRDEGHESNEGSQGLKSYDLSKFVQLKAWVTCEVFIYRSDEVAYRKFPRSVCLTSQAEGGA